MSRAHDTKLALIRSQNKLLPEEEEEMEDFITQDTLLDDEEHIPVSSEDSSSEEDDTVIPEDIIAGLKKKLNVYSVTKLFTHQTLEKKFEIKTKNVTGLFDCCEGSWLSTSGRCDSIFY